MVRLPQPGSDDGTWGNILNDFLDVSHNGDGTLKDPRLSDERVPRDLSVTDAKVADQANIAQSKIAGLPADLASKVSKSGDTMNGALTIAASSGAEQLLILKAASGQTANLQEWKDANGTEVGRIEADGTFRTGTSDIYTKDVWGRAFFGDSASLTAGAPTSTPATIKAYASQTADLQQWQDSTGTAQAGVNSTGGMYSKKYYVNNVAGNQVGMITTDGNNSLYIVGSSGIRLSSPIVPPDAATISLAVQARASQTADLQQWQDSAGAMLTKIQSDGRLYVNDSIKIQRPGQTTQTLRISMDGGVPHFDSGNGTFLFNNGATFANGVQIQNSNSGIGLSLIQGSSNGGIPLAVFKNGASAHADLLQFQDSTGNVLTNVTETGAYITTQDVEITDATKGIIMKSPDGTRYRVTVANGGTLTVTAA